MQKRVLALATSSAALLVLSAFHCATARADDMSHACANVGAMAGQVVEWRNGGVSENVVLDRILPHVQSDGARAYVRTIVTQLYHDNSAKRLSVDNAMTAYAADCDSKEVSGNMPH